MAIDTDLFYEAVWDTIAEEATRVLTLVWDGEGPAHSGAVWISKWHDTYFVQSSDYDPSGPFDSLDDALEEEPFTYEGTPKPKLTSSVLDLKQLKKIARKVGTQGKIIRINRQPFILRGKALRSVRAVSSSTSPRDVEKDKPAKTR
jgi:hypothetical protein